MRSYAAFAVGALAVVSLIGATLADMAGLPLPAGVAQDNQEAVAQELGNRELGNRELGNRPPVAVAPAGEVEDLPDPLGGVADRVAEPDRARVHENRARGIFIRPDGTVVGRVNYINRGTLRLTPVPNARVTFMQQRQVLAQGITGQDGMFEVSGLSAWAVYSLVVSSDDWVTTVSLVTRPYDHESNHRGRDLRPDGSDQAADAITNEIRLVSTNMTRLQDAEAGNENDEAQSANSDDGDGGRDEYMDYEFLELQGIPREDFNAALQQGLFGTDVVGPGGGSGGGLGGPGGGGGSGGGGSGGGAALGALGAALGAAAGLAGQDGGELSTPFTP